MKEKIKAYLAKPKLRIASDLLFWGLIILLIIPSTRSIVLGGVAKVKTAIFSPTKKAGEGPMLNQQDWQWTLSDLDGKVTTLEEFKNQVLLVNMWATWCPPCRAEMPSLEKLYKEKGQEIAMLLISDEEPAVVKEFIDKKGYTFPVYLAKTSTPPAFQSKGIPTTFIVSKKGQILLSKTGAVDWNSKRIHRFIDTQLNY